MGKFKFSFSDMMPSAWFCKSKRQDENPTEREHDTAAAAAAASYMYNLSVARKSHHFTRGPLSPCEKLTTASRPDPSRKSGTRTSQRRSRKSSGQPVDAAGCSCREALSLEKELLCPVHPSDSSDDNEEPGETALAEFRSDSVLPTESSDGLGSCSSGSGSYSSSKSLNRVDVLRHTELPPIITKVDGNNRRYDTSIAEWSGKYHSPGIRLRVKSPIIAHRRAQPHRRRGALSRGWSESFAMVKSSANPQEDFRESMMEMIVENRLWESKDLEELLACYLSLNADDYHHLIISVFKQIWLDLTTAPLPSKHASM